MAAKTPLASPQAGARTPLGAAERAAGSSARQDRLLADISHSLRNYFHKLYAWAERVQEQQPATADPEPSVLLERTIRELETFLETALELFRPMSVAPEPMPVEEFTRHLRTALTRHLAPAAVRWQVETDTLTGSVAIDPGRFSFVLDGMARRLDAANCKDVMASVQREGAGSLSRYVLVLAGRGSERKTDANAYIEWAVIERVVELHGGIVEASAVGSERTVRLKLPIRF